MRRAVLVFSLLMTAGCETTRQETLVVRGAPEWQAVQPRGQGSYDELHAGFRASPPPPKPMNTLRGSQVSLGGLITARQIIAQVSAEHGLAARTPTSAEQQGGWTEVYAGAGNQVAVREDDRGKYLYVDIRDKSGGALRNDLRSRLTAAGPSAATRLAE